MKNKKIFVLSLTVICFIFITGCGEKSVKESMEEAGLTFHDEQKACPVCGETLEPDTIGKEGCYREITGEYLTKEQFARECIGNPNPPSIPLPEESKRTCCPDCGETLEPGTFGTEGCYRTRSGYYLTKEQFVRLRLGLGTYDIDEHTAYALVGYDGADLCGEYVVINDAAGFVHTDDYVHMEPLSEKMTAEKVKKLAEDERIHQNDRYAGTAANIFAYYKIHRIYYDKQTDMWLVDYYTPAGTSALPYDYLQIFIDGNGVTKEIYSPDSNHTDDTMPDENTRIGQVTEVGEFSYAALRKSSGFVHKKEQQDVSRETLVSYARDEIKNSACASYLKEEPVIKLAPTNQEDTAFRISFYWEQSPLPVIHIYINKNGETTDMYVHEW